MKCQNLFSGNNEKNISICRLLNILNRVLSVKKTCIEVQYFSYDSHAQLHKLCFGSR